MAIDVTIGNPIRHIATIDSSTTFAVPPQANRVYVNVLGATGGGGGRVPNYNSPGGAGGAGHVAAGWVQVSAGSNSLVIIGAGGGAGIASNSAPTSGTAGGTTTFDGAITVTGGNGGDTGSTSQNSPGGAGSAGSSSGVTSLTTLSPTGAVARVSSFTSQATGGQAGGASGTVGLPGKVHIYG